MFVEERIYTMRAGGVAEYLTLYQNEGLAIQRRYLPVMVGYYTTEVGPLNQVVHLWGYRSFEERTQCRDAMRRDPAWAPYLKKIHPLILRMENKLLVPTPFFDLAALMTALGAPPSAPAPS